MKFYIELSHYISNNLKILYNLKELFFPRCRFNNCFQINVINTTSEEGVYLDIHYKNISGTTQYALLVRYTRSPLTDNKINHHIKKNCSVHVVVFS